MKIFCSGIGGIGLSAYASHMRSRGHDVSGSDKQPSAVTQALVDMGIRVGYVQDGSLLPDDCELLVYSEALSEDAPERAKAKMLGIRSLSYFAALGEMTRGATLSINIAGTHGKSSTTAMVAKMLLDCGHDPNVVVGTKMFELDQRNWRSGTGPWVVESCEYRRSFLSLHPTIVLLTTVDGDHFDAFRDIEDYRNAFREFIARVPEHGAIIYHGGDPDARALVYASRKRAIDADTFALPALHTPGVHMQRNAQLVLALAHELGIGDREARRSLQGFRGTWRRMEYKGQTSERALVVDDYAHHPLEIRSTLEALAAQHPDKKIVCVFQPHTHHRTLALWNEFAAAFKAAKTVIVPSIYDARPDRDTKLADPTRLADSIAKESRVHALSVADLQEAYSCLASSYNNAEWLIVTMGAGDITKLSDSLVVKPM